MIDTDSKRQLNWLASRLEASRISRRAFIGRALALGAGAALATSMADTAIAATAKKGGHLKLAMGHGSTTDVIDPAALVNGYQWALGYSHRNALTEVLPGGGLGPVLAESWESSKDAKTWTFKLRKGVEFHNGKTLTMEDVVDSINHHRSDESKSFMKAIMAEIEDLKADGDNLVATLSAGNADFPYAMASAGLTICPSNGDGTIDWQSGVGTGGYVLKRYDPGVRADLEKFENFWSNDRCHVDSVEFLTIADTTARTNALLTSEVDVVDQVDLKTADRLGKRPGINIEETAGPLHFTFPMNCDVAPFDNNDIRMAFKLAINREQMLQKILRGHGTVGNDTAIGPSYKYFAKELEQRTYDPDKARHHLKKAGLSEITVQLSVAEAAFAGAIDAGALYQEDAAKAGITIDLVREPNDGYWSNVWGVKPWVASYWGGYTTESEMFATGYTPGAAWNDTNWVNDRFQALMVEAKAETDEARRREMYFEMQKLMRDDGGALVPLFGNDVLARNDRVAHGALAADRGFDGRHIIERWWMV